MPLPPDFISELKRHFRGDVLTDTASRILYSTDASIYQMMPLGVAVPQTQDDLICALEMAAKYQIPILPRGGGSSLAGQAIGPALVLDTSRYLNKIIAIDPESQTATVEPGVVLARLNAAAARHGLQYGPDPASAERATMGGVIANNATGAHSILYGMSADHIVFADVILSDGSLATWGEVDTGYSIFDTRYANSEPTNSEYRISNSRISNNEYRTSDIQHQILQTIASIRATQAGEIRARWPKTWRNSAGYRLNYLLPWSPATPPQWGNTPYPPISNPQLPITNSQSFNLAPLLAGSEGTLAVIRTATVRLVRKPVHTILGVLTYDNIAAACDDVPRLLALQPSAVELIPQMLIRLARAVPAYAAQLAWVRGDPSALLVVEFSGETADGLRERAQALGADVVIAESREEQARVWNVRKVGLGILDSGPGPKRPVAFIEDCAIPVENLGEFVRELDKILAAHGTIGAYYAHASAGTLHVRPLLDLRTGEGVKSLRAIAEATLALTLRLGGAMSSEHGDGLLRSEFLEATYGPTLVEAMRALKRAADPHNLLNPGKILDTPPLDTHLRYGADYRSEGWASSLDFSAQGGLAGAIEQCNGAGVCRKDGGVMCPSFQATGIEMFSTRGRANLMRALVSAKPALPPETDVKHALDLCLACKGCKSECPSGVDIAKLKYAFLERYYRSHRRPLRDYLFAHIGAIGALVAVLRLGRPLNAVMAAPLVRRIIDPLFGINEKRPLPRFGHSPKRSTFNPSARLRQSGQAIQRFTLTPDTSSCETVLYLPDAFTRHFEPEIEGAALSLLQAAGIRFIEIPLLGAGRTLVSKGFLEEARAQHIKLLDAIRRLDPAGRLPILGIEPSELYTLKDELRDLVPLDRREEANSIAARAYLVDEFLIRKAPGQEKERVANLFMTSPERSEPIGERSRRADIENARPIAPETVLRLQATPSAQDLQPSNLTPFDQAQDKPDTSPPDTVLLHAHCYQKAQPPAPDGFQVGQAATAAFLRALGFEVEIVPSGCCGMAGAFGYEKEHYDVSMAVGELVLLPTVRAASPETRIAAPGASCRAQIANGAQRAADHPLVIAAQRIKTGD